jgi:hypothetical protein
MRIYDGSPRQDFEEALRSIGAFIDERGGRDLLLAETADGFFVQAIVVSGGPAGGWSEQLGTMTKESLTLLDEDLVHLMDGGMARRFKGDAPTERPGTGRYESSLRVIGQWIDQQKPRDIFFLEQDGAYVLRLLMNVPSGPKHVLAEFTKADVDEMIAFGPSRRGTRPGVSKTD